MSTNQANSNVKWLEAAIETSVDSIITINEKGIIQTVNQATIGMFGYSKNEMIGNSVSMLMPSPDKENHDGYIKNYLRTGQAKIIGIGREVEAQRKNGDIFWCLLSISEVQVEGVTIFTGVLHDISKLKHAELKMMELNTKLEQRVEERTEKLTEVVNQLLATNQKLEKEIDLRQHTENALKMSELELKKALEKEKELGDLKSQFVTLASHEFRTPLSTILSSANLIKRYTSTETQSQREKHLNKISKSVKLLTDILNDFLSIGKMDEGKLQVHIETINLFDSIIEVKELMQGFLKPNQKIVLNGAAESLVKADKHLVINMLTNLISNASKYSDEGKNITVTVEESEKTVAIAVADEGIGIPKNDQPKLFDRFFRAKNSLNIDGTGLGLHLVQSYAELVGGTVTFQSEEGIGSTFIIHLLKA